MLSRITMKTIKHNELYEHVSEFLRSRGIELKDGTFTRGIRRGCTLLTDTVNTAQQGLHKAKSQVETKVNEVRQAIHRKTAPRGAAKPAGRKPKPASSASAAGKARAAERPPARPKAQKKTAGTKPRKGSA